MENLVLGTLNFRYAFSSCPVDGEAIIGAFAKAGGKVIDTAVYYNNEEYIASVCDTSEFEFSTKACPWKDYDFKSGRFGMLSSPMLEAQLLGSLKRLGLSKCHTFYLHARDRETPESETLWKATELYRREKFDRFGVSNYSSAALRGLLERCDDCGYVRPTVYQGMYNLFATSVEDLFPLLSEYAVEFHAYNPLAGGLLSGKAERESGRFANPIYRTLFWNEDAVCEVGGVPGVRDKSLRWLRHHSSLRLGDKIVVGASSTAQLRENLESLLRPPLDSAEVTVCEELRKRIGGFAPPYYYD